MTITESVATEYAGHRFRSRLEARWAVFLDAAGIEWQYETRIVRVPSGRDYLPDFWLPGPQQYAECKGFLYPEAFARIMSIASRLRHDIVILGPLPGWFDSRWPVQLHRHRGIPASGLFAVPWRTEPGCPAGRAIPRNGITPELLLAGYPVVCPEWAEEPLSAARRYRFPATSGPSDPRQRLPRASRAYARRGVAFIYLLPFTTVFAVLVKGKR